MSDGEKAEKIDFDGVNRDCEEPSTKREAEKK